MKLLYHPKVKIEDIPRLDNAVASRIRKVIGERLMADPLKYGFFLHGSLHGYRKIRVGDWRIVYRISADAIKIIAIGHRKDSAVYKEAESRI